jgi:hypothetical protein
VQQQEKQQKMQAIAQRTLQNAQALKEYSWTMRTEVRQEEEVKNVQLAQVRFDIDGQPQVTPISAPQDNPDAKGVRPGAKRRRQKKIDNKVEEQQEFIQSVISHSNRYTSPSQAGLQKLFQTGQIWEGKGSSAGTIRVEVNDFIIPNDSMTLTIDAQTQKLRKTEVTTSLDGDPVLVNVDHRDLPNGPTYAARTLIDLPEEKMQIKVETFDYVSQGAAGR